MKNPIISINGRKLEANQALLKVLMPGVVRGEGIFETILILDGQMCFWKEHYARLCYGAKKYKLKKPQTKLKSLAENLIRVNKIAQGRLRIQYYRDGADEFVVLVVIPLDQRSKSKKSISVAVSNHKFQKIKLSDCKNLHYNPYYEEHIKAKRLGFDEAVLIDSEKNIVEGSTTNIFFQANGVLHTPALKLGCLNGIVRQKVIELARKEGVSVKVGLFTLAQLKKADEVFLTNSLIGLRKVSLMDSKKWEASPSALLKQMSKKYQSYLNC